MKVAKRPLYSIFLFSSFFSALFLRMTHCDLTDGQGRRKRSEWRRGGGLLTAAEYKKWLSYVIRLRVELLLIKIASFSLLQPSSSPKSTCHSALKVREALMEKWGPLSSDGRMSFFSMWFVFIVSYNDEHTFIVALALVKAIKRP